MKISFYDIVKIAPIEPLKTALEIDHIALIIKDENELQLFSGKNGFLKEIKQINEDVDQNDLFDDYGYISKLLRGIKYYFLKYDAHLKVKHLYPNFEPPYSAIDIDYKALYEKHKNILKPDDHEIVNKPADITVHLTSTVDSLFEQALKDVYNEYSKNLNNK